MNPIALHIKRISDTAATGQPLSIGVPLPRGYAATVQQLQLRDLNDEPINCDLSVSQTWPDGSPRWVLVRFAITEGLATAQLVSTASDHTPQNPFEVVEGPEEISVRAGEYEFLLARDGRGMLPRVMNNGYLVWGGKVADHRICVTDDQGVEIDLETESMAMESVGAHSVRWHVRAKCLTPAHQPVSIDLHFTLSAERVLSCRCVVHNGARARHAGGLWDLGDPGSFMFRALKLCVSHSADRIAIRTRCGEKWHSADAASEIGILQSSSGGENWQSPVHVDAEGQLPAIMTGQPNGYRLTVDDNVAEQGARCQPVVDIAGGNVARYQASLQDYWQNFPSGLRCSADALVCQLFPDGGSSPHELQAGERKGQSIHFSFGDDSDALDWVENRAIVVLEPAVYQQACALRYSDGEPLDRGYDDLLEIGLSETAGYVAKREAVDEYGWRHYGEIYADHETAFDDGDGVFVSHYNNQYDPVYGFARQFALSADPRWYDLMQTLASHVMDIDVYRTELDRAEYNNGLFWHTDHYKQAHTCTHRTFSRHQYASDWSGPMGGGPGPEHCYTSGLKLYYLMTGDREARETVLGLAAWITAYYEGGNTLVERCLGTRQDLHQTLTLLKGNKTFRYRYPFSRGTGNYIRALLDSFELTGDNDYLTRAETVIRHTFGPSDDIAMRGLEDVEHTWFYTVFLQEVAHYLDVKREQGTFDTAFEYARQGLLHYARWMVEHEGPSLDYDKLEYPNATWVAQDIRKVEVLYAAYCYATDQRESFLQRAVFFRDYVISELRKSDTAHYARIQIILLQNHGPSGLLHLERATEAYSEALIEDDCFQSVAGILGEAAGRWGRALARFNPAREIRWLRTRFQ